TSFKKLAQRKFRERHVQVPFRFRASAGPKRDFSQPADQTGMSPPKAQTLPVKFARCIRDLLLLQEVLRLLCSGGVRGVSFH
ncbi:MAG: hypothetical protein ACR2OY_14290, partial [Boseongicola sp.]